MSNNSEIFIDYYRIKEPHYPIEAWMIGPRLLFPGFKDEELVPIFKKRRVTFNNYRENNDADLIELDSFIDIHIGDFESAHNSMFENMK